MSLARLDSGCHQHCLSFLPVCNVITSVRVSKHWQTNFPITENYWRILSLQENVHPHSSAAVAYGLGTTILGQYFSNEGVAPEDSRRCWRICKLIAEYAPDCMHRLKAEIVTGKIEFYRGAWDVCFLTKGEGRRWGNDEVEPFIDVRCEAEEKSVHEWKRDTFFSKHPNNATDLKGFVDFYMKGPHEMPIPKLIQEMPYQMPLRCFFDRTYQMYRFDGDPIRLSIKGRKVILLCSHREETCETLPPVRVTGFIQALTQRIKVSRNNGYLNDEIMQQVKAMAKSNPTWISPD